MKAIAMRKQRLSDAELLLAIKDNVAIIRAHGMALRQRFSYQANFSKVEDILGRAEEISKSKLSPGMGSVDVGGERQGFASAGHKSKKDEYAFLYSKYIKLNNIETQLFHILTSGKIIGF